MYDKTSTYSSIDKARNKLFTKYTAVKRIPPTTRAALEQHQGGHGCGKHSDMLPAGQD
jgi:hypothetical protein